MASMLVRILIPAYNESSRIERVVRDYCAEFSRDGIVTVIANACTDDTIDVVERLMTEYPNLHLLTINGKIGKGGAVRAGFKVGDETFVGFTDADGSTAASEFRRLWELCRSENADGAIGSRWSPQSVVAPAQPKVRRFASRCFNTIVRALFRLSYRDTQCGAKVFRRAAVAAILWQLELADFAFDIDLLYQLRRTGKRILELPIRWSDVSGSKVDVVRASGSMLLSILRLKLRNSRARCLPFVEYIGRKSAIPVREPVRLLVLNRRTDGMSPDVRECLMGCIHALTRGGCAVEWIDDVLPAAAPASRLRRRLDKVAFLRWYVFGTDRPYDALIEVETDAPSLIPVFSVKPTFLLRSSQSAGSLVTDLYRSVVLSIDEQSTPADVARAVLGRTAGRALYAAAFREEESNWTLHFSDLDSGMLRHTELR